MNKNATMEMSGNLSARKIKVQGAPLAWKISNYLNWRFIKSLIGVFVVRPIARAFGLMTGYGKLEALLIRADGSKVNYGVLSYRVVSTAFCAFVVDQLQTDTTEFGDFKFHDSGVGTTAENAADTAMETTDGESRATGSQTESSSTAYRSVGTISYTTTKAITEHGVFSQAAAATLMDRSVFSAINVINGDSVQFTYTLTLSAGG
jgi:hypothetical protein